MHQRSVSLYHNPNFFNLLIFLSRFIPQTELDSYFPEGLCLDSQPELIFPYVHRWGQSYFLCSLLYGLKDELESLVGRDNAVDHWIERLKLIQVEKQKVSCILIRELLNYIYLLAQHAIQSDAWLAQWMASHRTNFTSHLKEFLIIFALLFILISLWSEQIFGVLGTF